ncbi:MAG: GcrA family cell cycle regulator [Kiloniellales bacterium]|nr:GcrA family cell cycle regulator [Kiloniellales bacterium]
MTWTPERIEELTKLWDAGYTASHIGKLLGVSKNAVVGKAHRLKLASRPSPIRSGPSVPRLRTPAPKVRRPALEVVAKPAPRPARTPRRRTAGGPGCLWPIGDPGDPDFHFCGENAVPGKPYCEAHCARAYIVKSRPGSEAA